MFLELVVKEPKFCVKLLQDCKVNVMICGVIAVIQDAVWDL